MYLFKAVVMCGQCGDVHNEKWLESKNRHAGRTVLEMLCEPCAMNNLIEEPHEFSHLCDCIDCEYKRIADLDADVHHTDCQCIECEHPTDFTELDNHGNPLPDFVDPFERGEK